MHGGTTRSVELSAAADLAEAADRELRAIDVLIADTCASTTRVALESVQQGVVLLRLLLLREGAR